MDELLAKDLAFFHNNYAGSLTKRALGFARRFEDVFDVMAFQVSASFLPLGFAGAVLWQYSPWLIVVLVGHAADHVRADGAADPPPAAAGRHPRNRVERPRRASRRFDRQRGDGARVRARSRGSARCTTQNVSDFGAKTLRSWDYQNARVDMLASPMFVLTNLGGLARRAGRRQPDRRQPRGGVPDLQLLRAPRRG